VVISHEKESTKRLFDAVRFFIETAKVKPAMSIDSRSEIKFPKRGSSYFIGTAGQRAFGRGDTINRAHLSEAAFYDNLGRILAGISEAAEYGTIDIETTANGRGEFYDLWQKAKSGKSPYTPIFIPWFIDDEYSVGRMTEDERKGLSPSVQEMFSMPIRNFMASLTKEEKMLMARVKSEWNIELTASQLKWRRYKIWDKGQLFWQEYPEDDVSCFLQSGRTVFSKITLDSSRRIPLDDLDKWQASDEEKRALKKRRLYAGVDGAEGTLTGDAHSFAVIDIPPKKPAAVVFEITSNEPIDEFWEKVSRIVKKYTMTLGIEKNGVGVAHVRKADQLGLNFEEWNTTGTGEVNRSAMITDLEEAYRKEELIETYSEAENELRDMEYGEKNRAEAKKGKHDDRVFARSIALQMIKQPTPGVEWL